MIVAAGQDSAGPLALLLILLLFAATVLLVRSMSRHLRRLPESFDPPVSPPDDDAAA